MSRTAPALPSRVLAGFCAGLLDLPDGDAAELAARNAGAPARPDAQLHVVPAAQWPDRRRTDVVVVGSGAGVRRWIGARSTPS